MPIYEYECKSCRHKFEQLQKITEDPLYTCPNCGKEKLIKLISNTSFQLKGTGWYATDFKDKKTVIEKPTDTNNQTTNKKKEPEKTKKVEKTKDSSQK